jgi:hypothetical protein
MRGRAEFSLCCLQDVRDWRQDPIIKGSLDSGDYIPALISLVAWITVI